MTDHERWLTATDPAWMLTALGDAADERRMQLWVRECRKIELPEAAGWHNASVSAGDIRHWATIGFGDQSTSCDLIRCIWPPPMVEREWVECSKCCNGLEIVIYATIEAGNGEQLRAPYAEEKIKCRKCKGKCFTLSTLIDPRWRTPLVMGLTMRIAGVSPRIRLDEEPIKPQPDLMPILSDALMDAGCEVREIIEHLKADCRHMAECWVIGGLLGGATQPIESM